MYYYRTRSRPRLYHKPSKDHGDRERERDRERQHVLSMPAVCVCVCVCLFYASLSNMQQRPFLSLFLSCVCVCVCVFTQFHCHSYTQELLHFVFVEKTDSKPDPNVSFGQCSSWAAPKRLAWIACKHGCAYDDDDNENLFLFAIQRQRNPA